MDNPSIWTIVPYALPLLGVIVGACLNNWFGIARDKRTRKADRELHARYLATRVAFNLDTFVNKCLDVVRDDGVDDQEGYRSATVEEPKLTFPDDVVWSSIDHNLMYRVLDFPNAIENAHQYIIAAIEFADPPDYSEVFDARKSQFSKLALSALDLASALRKAGKIPERDSGDANPKKILEEILNKVKAEREAAQARNDEFMEELAAKHVKPEQPTTPKEP